MDQRFDQSLLVDRALVGNRSERLNCQLAGGRRPHHRRWANPPVRATIHCALLSFVKRFSFPKIAGPHLAAFDYLAHQRRRTASSRSAGTGQRSRQLWLAAHHAACNFSGSSAAASRRRTTHTTSPAATAIRPASRPATRSLVPASPAHPLGKSQRAAAACSRPLALHCGARNVCCCHTVQETTRTVATAHAESKHRVAAL